MVQKVLLKYSTEKADKPILASIIRETDIPINILHADLTPKGGEIFIELDASDEEVDEVIQLFEERGVETEKITHGIEFDEDICLDCGACISLCPTKALTLTDDCSLKVEEEKCVYCGACVPVCPVNALSVRKI